MTQTNPKKGPIEKKTQNPNYLKPFAYAHLTECVVNNCLLRAVISATNRTHILRIAPTTSPLADGTVPAKAAPVEL